MKTSSRYQQTYRENNQSKIQAKTELKKFDAFIKELDKKVDIAKTELQEQIEAATGSKASLNTVQFLVSEAAIAGVMPRGDTSRNYLAMKSDPVLWKSFMMFLRNLEGFNDRRTQNQIEAYISKHLVKQPVISQLIARGLEPTPENLAKIRAETIRATRVKNAKSPANTRTL
ncbi:hypothetical protein [Aeromonas veronii]|uniref:hypothetical protein n=1 Tax=Aeromonas veronii TaxID=654 RepID=UPI003006FF99